MHEAQGNTRLARLLLRITGITTALMFLPVCCEASTVNGGMWAIMLLPLGFGLFSLVYATSQGLWFERRCERVWKATCCGLDGFKGTARSYKFGLVGAFILGDSKTIYPKLREVHGTNEAWTGIVTPFAGQTIEEYNEHTTEAGKNSYTWSLVFGLAKARKAGVVRLWGRDPKKVELAFGRECWDEYADTVEGMVDLLEKAVSGLLGRNKLIQGKSRKIFPSPVMPLNVIIIDELAYLSVMVPDKKLREAGAGCAYVKYERVVRDQDNPAQR